MSNTQVGAVYNKIMEQVVEECRVAFEEEGVEQAALEELKKTWQKNLSNRNCASMPWEPAPQPIAPTPGTQSSNSARPQAQPLSATTGPAAPSIPNSGPAGVQVKTEPGTGYDLQNLPLTNGIPRNYGNQAALQRAGQNLQEKFGASASLQVNQLQARAAMAAQNSQGGARPANQTTPVQPNEEHRRQAEAHRQYAQQQQRQQQQQYQNMQSLQQAQQRPAAVKNVQTDGTSDWDALVSERRADAQHLKDSTSDADVDIRKQIDKINRDLEGGGLMRPFSEHRKHPVSSKKRKTASSRSQDINIVSPIPQLDGRDDTDEDDDKTGIKDDPDINDEDAINSDLDDPNDDVIDETEDDDNKGEVMLCTYDKVQRVKNKWKCTLKDGVLTTGGREYVFHKATGEFEW